MAAKTTDMAPALVNIESAMTRFSETVGKTAFGKDFMRVFDFLSGMNPVSAVGKLVSALGAQDASNAPAFGVGGRPSAYSQMGVADAPGGPGDANTYTPFKKPKTATGPDPVALFNKQLDDMVAAQKVADAAMLEDSKSLQAYQIALAQGLLDARQIDEATFLQQKMGIDATANASAIAAAQKLVDADQLRLGSLIEIQDSQALTAKQGVELSHDIEKATTDLITGETALNKVRNAGATQHITDSNAIVAAMLKEQDVLQKEIDSYGKFLESLQKDDDLRAFNTSLIGKSTDAILLMTAAHTAGVGDQTENPRFRAPDEVVRRRVEGRSTDDRPDNRPARRGQ